MKRDKKNLQMRKKIIDNACQEFSEKSYGEASLNNICSAGNISKGIIYHYFKDKDALYLSCVKECFDAMTEYLHDCICLDGLSVEVALSKYFDARTSFFDQQPIYLGLFYSAILNPPAHLAAALDEMTADFDAQAVSILTSLLKTVKLRQDLSIEMVVEVFREYQDFVNTRFLMQFSCKGSLKEHELRCLRALTVLLYGVIER